MIRYVLIFVFAVYGSSVWSINLSLHNSAVQNASSGLIHLFDATSGTELNPAYHFSGIETGMTRLFNFSELSYYTMQLAQKRGRLGFFLGASHLNHHLYKESNLNLSFSVRRDDYSYGLALRFLENRVTDYNRDLAFLLDIGFSIRREVVTNSFAIRNITQTKIESETLPVTFLWELNVKTSSAGSLSLGLEKERHYDFTLKLGAAYRLHPYITIISSYQYEPDRIGMGVVLLPDVIKLHYGVLTHEYLQLTHFVSLSYDL